MKNIAILTAGLDVNHANRIVNGIKVSIHKNKANAFIFTCKRRYRKNIDHDQGEYNIYNLPDFAMFDGVVLVNSTVGCDEVLESMARKIEMANIPTVGVERDDGDMLNVCIDNKMAMREMVEHFVKVHGFKRLNIVTGPLENDEARLRLEAYKEVLTENGIPIEKGRIFVGDFLKPSGMIAAETFLNSTLEKPQVIISANDLMAVGVYEVLEKHGINVPQEIAISGFDDDFEAKYYVPSITTVSRNQEEAGYEAFERILHCNEGECLSGKVMIPTSLQIRESCGCNIKTKDDGELFRKYYYERKGINELYMSITQEMSADLTGVESFEKLRILMRRYFLQIECEGIYLFLCSKFPDNENSAIEPDWFSQGYEGDSFLLIGYENYSFIENKNIDFEKFLQNVREKNLSEKVYVISPIHYGKQCYGYFVICNSEFPFENQNYYSFLMNIGNAIESIRKQSLLQTMIDKLDAIWSFDALTNVYNRSGLKKYGSRVWEDGMKEKGIILLFMDLDSLKKVNDTYGHEEGDFYIKSFAQILIKIKKHGELIVRYGGDEFLFMAPLSQEMSAASYVEEIKREIREFNCHSDLNYELDASIGYHIIKPEDKIDMEAAIEIADSKMYEEKKKKKCR